MKKLKKMKIKAVTIFLAVSCILSSVPFTFAAERRISIANVNDWHTFVNECSTDFASADMSVELKEDINLRGESNIIVPIFCGKFNGNGHTISGITFEARTDVTGLFRIVSEEAVIDDLHISASVQSSDNISTVGILCGENRGTLSGCSVRGNLSSWRETGGLAGKNTGIIKNCTSKAVITGTYRVGAIAGTNDGTLENCRNMGGINQAANESATNVGGIAGVNENLILSCTNDGNIGYLHTGYNIGGIAGISRGFVKDCRSTGTISGRRDVGGIIGQMEPSFRLEYGQNAMELLGNSASGFSAALKNAGSVIETAVKGGASGLNEVLTHITGLAQKLSAGVSSLFAGMQWQDDAKSSLEGIRTELQYIRDHLPLNPETRGLIDQIKNLLGQFNITNPSVWMDQLEQLTELISELTGKITGFSGLYDSVNRLTDHLNNLAGIIMGGFQNFGDQSSGLLKEISSELGSLSSEIKQVLSQAGTDIGNVHSEAEKISDSLSALQTSAEKVLAGNSNTIEDISSQITSQDKGMAVSCINQGSFSADYNIGGIVGNLSKELTMDQEADAFPSFDEVLNTDTTLFIRATVYECSNFGNASAKYDNAGGIVGFGNCGAIVSSENSGNTEVGKSCAGGIAGSFRGTISDCSSLGLLKGLSCVGGIAGDADCIRRCVSLPVIEEEGSFFGGIAGKMTDGEGNLFAGQVPGGNNGISYTGVAEKADWEDLLAEGKMPDDFRELTIRFEVEGEFLKDVTVPYGGSVKAPPEVPAKDGKYWCWNSFRQNEVCCNQVVDGQWKNYITTLASKGEFPEFLVEGQFDNQACLIAEPGETDGSYFLSVEGCPAETLTVRFLTEKEGKLTGENGKLSYIRDGRYIVFEIPNGSLIHFTPDAEEESSLLWLYLTIGGIILAGIILTVCLLIRHRKKKKQQNKAKNTESSDHLEK